MIAALRAGQPWSDRPYRRIASVDGDDDILRICFEDGSCRRLAVDRLLPPDATVTDWRDLTSTPHDVTIPTTDGEVGVSWMTIRALTDPAFEAHLQAMAAEEDRLIGDRIAALRTGQGLTVEELARRAELPLETVTRVEAGETQAGFSLLERILTPLGATLDDLMVEPESAAVPTAARRSPMPT